MRTVVAIGLIVACSAPTAAVPPTLLHVPRLDAEGVPLPNEAIRRLGTQRFRTSFDAACWAVFSPDGRTVYAAANNVVYAWDAATGRRKFEIALQGFLPLFGYLRPSEEGVRVWGRPLSQSGYCYRILDPDTGRWIRDTDPVRTDGHGSVDLSQDGSWFGEFISREQPNSQSLYQLTMYQTDGTGKPINLFTGVIGQGYHVSADGKRLALIFLQKVLVFDLQKERVIREWACPEMLNSHATGFTPDGQRLLMWTYRKPGAALYSWDLADNEPKLVLELAGTEVPIRSSFTPDGKKMAGYRRGREVVFLDPVSGLTVGKWADSIGNPGPFSPDGRTCLTYGSLNAIAPVDAKTGQPTAAAPDPPWDVWALAGRADGSVVGLSHSTAITWDQATGKELRRVDLTAHDRSLWVSALSPDGMIAALTIRGGKDVLLVDPRTGLVRARLPTGGGRVDQVLRITAGGRRVVGHGNGRVGVWDDVGKRLLDLLYPGTPPVVAVSADNRWVAIAAQRQDTVEVHDLSGRRPPAKYSREVGGTEDLAFTPDGRLLVSVGGIANVRTDLAAWDVETGRRVLSNEVGSGCPLTRCSISPDGRMVAAAGYGETQTVLIDLTTGKVRHWFPSYSTRLAFSPDGRHLLTASTDAPVYVWDVRGELNRQDTTLKLAHLERFWRELGSDDVAVAFRAVRRLSGGQTASVDFLRKQYSPSPKPDPDRIRRLIAKLDSPSFVDREEAVVELKQMTDDAYPMLKEAARTHPSFEVRRLVSAILAATVEMKWSTSRQARTVEALEWIGTPEAVEVLHTWARGGGRLASEAKAAMERLDLTRK